MKVWATLLLCIVAGAAAGYGRTQSELWGLTNHFEPHNGSAAPFQAVDAPQTAKQPRAVVPDGDIFNFNTMERHASREHTFRIQNTGEAPLQVTHKRDQVSCGLCIECNFENATLAPGEVAEVVVKYSTRKSHPEFSESARIETNDPLRPIIELRIEGHVVNSVRMIPEELTWSNVSAGEGASNEVKIYGFIQQPVEILRHELVAAESARYFQVDVRTLTGEELAEMPEARSGVAVHVQFKPGAPLGRIHQTIRLFTSITDSAQLEIPVVGRVVSDINVYGGKDFYGEVNLLKFGTLKPNQGAKASLFLRVKGPYREDVQLSVGTIEPEGALRATIGPRRAGASGTVHIYPLTIEVVPGARPIPRIPGKLPYAKVMIQTTHPDAKQLPIYVEYSIAE